MTEFNEIDLSFVARCYREDRYDTRKAIARFHETNKVMTTHRRWWATAAAAVASIVLVFAAGYGIRTWVRNTQEPSPVEQLTLNPNVAETHLFVYENAPLDQVLADNVPNARSKCSFNNTFACIMPSDNSAAHASVITFFIYAYI